MQPGAGPVISVENLRVERDAVVVDDISWSVEPGEHWAILGPNGSGKTSLLSAVTGYLIPTRGEIQIGSARFGQTDWRDVRRWVGLVSTSLGQRIEPEQTAREVVLSGYDAEINYWARPNEAQARGAVERLAQVKASHLAERPWRALSQGERQRVLIGRALLGHGTILFLDEPCAGLDPVARDDFLRFLEQVARVPKAPALVLITHHVEEILPLFTHVLLLRAGRVLAAGRREAVLTSSYLSQAFDTPLRLTQRQGRYHLVVRPRAASFRSPRRLLRRERRV